MKKKRISILNFDISNNSLGRAYLLAKVLDADFDVCIVGPALRGSVWGPLRGAPVEIREVPSCRFPRILSKLPSILRAIDGEIVYAVKPRFSSFGFALLKKLASGTPVVLDIDDWETSSYLGKGFWSRALKFLNLSNPNGYFWTWVMEFLIRFADRKTTVSTFLQKKYGGLIIPHVKDTESIDPAGYDEEALRGELGLAGKRIVMFAGTPREHKGVTDALHAVSSIPGPETVLVVVGGDLEGVYERKLQAMGSDRLMMFGQAPYRDLLKFLKIADVVVIPQRYAPGAQGQLPSKLFDAMAMGKAIVATAVSDIPLVLNGCGIVVNAGSVDGLADGIRRMLDDPGMARELGRRARLRCEELYSVRVAREKLRTLLSELQ